jgi:hypothetical protein
MSDRVGTATGDSQGISTLGELIEEFEAQERFEESARRTLEIHRAQLSVSAFNRQQGHIINSRWELGQCRPGGPPYALAG